MYEPMAKNSITERVEFTGVAILDHAALEGWEAVAAEAAHAPQAYPDTGSFRPNLERRSTRPTLQAIRS